MGASRRQGPAGFWDDAEFDAGEMCNDAAVHLLVEVLPVIDCLNLRIFQRRRAAVLQLLRVLLPGEVPGGTGHRKQSNKQ